MWTSERREDCRISRGDRRSFGAGFDGPGWEKVLPIRLVVARRNRKQRWGRCPRFAPPFSKLGHHASSRSGWKPNVRTGMTALRPALKLFQKRFGSFPEEIRDIGSGGGVNRR